MIVKFMIDGTDRAEVNMESVPRVGDLIDYSPDMLYVKDVEWVLEPGRKPFVKVHTDLRCNRGRAGGPSY